MHAVHAEAAGQQLHRSDRPVVLRSSVLHIGVKDYTIAFGPRLAVANDGGYGVVVVIAAVACANHVLGGNLLLQLNVELTSRRASDSHCVPDTIRAYRTRYVDLGIAIQNRQTASVDVVAMN